MIFTFFRIRALEKFVWFSRVHHILKRVIVQLIYTEIGWQQGQKAEFRPPITTVSMC